ncbi:hypothetical protein OCU04_006352 [Sclerotinia nivalis]|uniref:Heterokaryon incompatibility domain-containing protein n=1 Tax=Sclerotinia nivalis TaxID=352851 RepID=A0A9X0AN25_9HELO|nr:hypothetical protein OCU04_006352 [Sclerotinia nivalis]
MLCKACQQIFCGHRVWTADQIEHKKYAQHHPSLQLLIDASDSGCWICHKLLASLSRDRNIEEIPSKEYSSQNYSKWSLSHREYPAWYSGPKYSLTLSFSFGNEYHYEVSLVPHNDYDGPARNYHASIAGISTMSDAALAQATMWYHECLSKHPACNTSLASTRRMPTRLLRINEDQSYARLIISKEEVTKDSHYSTLSHCWGNSDILKLTTSSLDKFKAGIPLKLLPKTFIEAIYVARKMSIPYLWIDSLCIVQDSVADWQTESASMEYVYGNSSLNIMATASKNSHEGLSRVRDPKLLETCPAVQSKWDNAENNLFYLINCGSWADTMIDAPLLKRGWVLQERVLSPRSLHFCNNELLWECRKMAVCETYPNGQPELCRFMQSKVKLGELSGSELYGVRYLVDGDIANKTEKGIAYDRWEQWISIYSQTHLTKASDKLVAVSALAKCTRAVLNDIYLAGLWRTEFVDQLIWHAKWGSRPREYQAPSWSWASVNGEISLALILPHTKYHIEIDSVQVTPASSVDDTGFILEGHFQARGLLIRDTLVKHPRYNDYSLVGNDNHTIMQVQPDALVNEDETSVVVLPILTYSENPRHYGLCRFHALLLQKRTGSPNGFYTRIGHMESENSFIQNEKGLGFEKSVRKLGFLRKHVSSASRLYKSLRNGKGTDLESESEESLYLADSPGSFVVY